MTKLHLAPDLSMPLEAVTQTFGVLAIRGAGKTYTARVLTEQLVGAGLPVVVLDPVGVWWGLRSSADGRSRGLSVVVFGGEHGDLPLDEEAGAAIADLLVAEPELSAVLDLSNLRKAAAKRFVTAFAEQLYHRKAKERSPRHVMLDEADEFAPQKPQPGEQRLLGAIEDLVRRGRARGLGVTMITQRAAVLNKDVLTQIETLIVLRTTSPQDRKAIETWVQAHATPEDLAKVAASLPSLANGEAWVWSPAWLRVLQRVYIDRSTTFDSSATPKVGEKRIQPKVLADVDVAVLRERLGDLAKEADANDPVKLKAKIAQLERAAAARPAAAPPALPTRVEVPVVDVETRRALVAAGELVRNAERAIAEAGEAWNRIAGTLKRIDELASRPTSPSSRSPSTATRAPAVRPPSRTTTPATPAADGGPSKGERRMLEALARRHPIPLTPDQLGLLSGYTRRGGTFRTYLPRLVTAGLVRRAGSNLELTPAGEREVGVPPPQSMEETRAMWLRALEQGPRRMLEVLIGTYPDGLSKDDLGERSGYAAAGGTFRTYAPKLKRLGLVVVRDGLFFASDILFEGA